MALDNYNAITLGWKEIDGKFFVTCSCMEDGKEEWDEYVLLKPYDSLEEAKRDMEWIAKKMQDDAGMKTSMVA